MASVKLGSLLIRTLAKPISNRIKQQAQDHPRFREICMDFAQFNYRLEYRLRSGLLGESPKTIKPLSEAKAVANGANALAEGFLFLVAAGIILGETWRSSRAAEKRRDKVDDSLDDLKLEIQSLVKKVDDLQQRVDEQVEETNARQDEVTRILDRIIYIGLRGGWNEMHDAPLMVSLDSEPTPAQLDEPPSASSDSNSSSNGTSSSSDS